MSENALTEKVCFVTGGGSGIGKATVEMLLGEGAKVFVLERSAERADALRAEFGDSFLRVHCGNVADEASVREAFAACRYAFGPVDILINNAGVGVPTPDLAAADLSAFETMMDVNLKGVFLCTREALADMKAQGKGHILTLISMAGQRTNPGAPLYCASKFGARGLSGGLADQVLKLGIKVTDINPGPVDSAYWGDRTVPREKFLKPEDVAGVIRFVLTAPEHMVVREINFDNIHWLAQ